MSNFPKNVNDDRGVNEHFYVTYANILASTFILFFAFIFLFLFIAYLMIDNFIILSFVHCLYLSVFQDYLFFTVELNPLRYNGKELSEYAVWSIVMLEIFCLGHLIILIYWIVIVILSFFGHSRIILASQIKDIMPSGVQLLSIMIGSALVFPGFFIFFLDGHMLLFISENPNFIILGFDVGFIVALLIYFTLHLMGQYSGVRTLFVEYVPRYDHQKRLIGKAALNHLKREK